MKTRLSLVSNSSTTSFMIHKSDILEDDLDNILYCGDFPDIEVANSYGYVDFQADLDKDWVFQYDTDCGDVPRRQAYNMIKIFQDKGIIVTINKYDLENLVNEFGPLKKE